MPGTGPAGADLIADAQRIESGTFSARTPNASLGSDLIAYDGGTDELFYAAWWQYVAPEAGWVSVSALAYGADVEVTNLNASGDPEYYDGPWSGGAFHVEQFQVLYIAVGRWSSTPYPQDYSLYVSRVSPTEPAPYGRPADLIENAPAANVGAYSDTSSPAPTYSRSASDPFVEAFGDFTAWAKWTPERDVFARVVGGSQTTVVYEGDPPDFRNPVVMWTPNLVGSAGWSFRATAGTTYYFFFASYGDTTWSPYLQLKVTPYAVIESPVVSVEMGGTAGTIAGGPSALSDDSMDTYVEWTVGTNSSFRLAYNAITLPDASEILGLQYAVTGSISTDYEPATDEAREWAVSHYGLGATGNGRVFNVGPFGSTPRTARINLSTTGDSWPYDYVAAGAGSTASAPSYAKISLSSTQYSQLPAGTVLRVYRSAFEFYVMAEDPQILILPPITGSMGPGRRRFEP